MILFRPVVLVRIFFGNVNIANSLIITEWELYMFREIWESRQSTDSLGILRILRLPRQSAIAVYN